jgi:nucleotidyltransferase substrate binding protein (TIGR01987 family)
MNRKPKLTRFIKAMENLKSILKEEKTPTVRDAAIKRYELCYELAWKSIQEALKTQGLEVCKSPKACFKQAFEQGWITDEETFSEIVQKRNLTTYTSWDADSISVMRSVIMDPWLTESRDGKPFIIDVVAELGAIVQDVLQEEMS